MVASVPARQDDVAVDQDVLGDAGADPLAGAVVARLHGVLEGDADEAAGGEGRPSACWPASSPIASGRQSAWRTAGSDSRALAS